MSIDRSHLKVPMIAGAILLLLLGLAVWFSRGYGQVSEQAYDLATSLVSACNLQSSERVELIAQCLQADLANGSLPANDARYLTDIIQLAQAGQWEPAQTAARKLVQTQAVIANDLPHLD
jgi:hypothetical protein